MMTILPTDAARLRAVRLGCWPVPMIFGGPVIVVARPRHLAHDSNCEHEDDTKERIR